MARSKRLDADFITAEPKTTRFDRRKTNKRGSFKKFSLMLTINLDIASISLDQNDPKWTFNQAQQRLKNIKHLNSCLLPLVLSIISFKLPFPLCWTHPTMSHPAAQSRPTGLLYNANNPIRVFPNWIETENCGTPVNHDVSHSRA